MDRNLLIISAVLVLSVSNLFVGISTQNALLVYASSAISAALAGLYLMRDRFPQPPTKTKSSTSRLTRAEALSQPRPFPLWVFAFVLFVALPALLLFLQMNMA